MNKERIFIGLGSNIGDKLNNINTSLSLMEDKGIKIIKLSSLIETEPYGYKEQDTFLNGVVEIDFNGTPEKLLDILLGIENEMKRKRVIHWGPRVIDLDILLWGKRIINEPDLIVPHPDMHNRSFVLGPLNEIAPQIIHPKFGLNVQQLLKKLK